MAEPRAVPTSAPPPQSPITVTPGDNRYGDLVRGINDRFVGRPELVRVARSTAEVVQAVQEAVRAGQRLAVRSGGHCYEDFVAHPDVRVVLDLGEFTGISFDQRRGAFAVGAGTTLGEVYRSLFKRWGVTVPGGGGPTVAVGGHVPGGGYGPLSRLHGSIVDYLHAVEVVVVDEDGTARCVTASSDPDDPHHDLWWAHTGGGGGNFGVVTRYWFRSPGGTAADPALLLPRAPAEVVVSTTAWSWDELDETAFGRLVGNHGSWFERHSAPDSPFTGLYSMLALTHRASGAIAMVTQVDGTNPGAERLLADYVAAVGDGVRPVAHQQQRMPWWHSTRWPGIAGDGDMSGSVKVKAAYLRQSYTPAQIATLYRYLTRTDYANPGALVGLIAYGGKVNTVSPRATALAQRDSMLKAVYVTTWSDRADAEHLAWIREFYRDVYADTGGVPVPGAGSDGSYINYPDADLADPAWNSSGVPWHTLYYKDNYPRLQQVKGRWDPGNVFRHRLSISPAPESASRS
ncbi:FAD-dependent oxidoreductase [Goodfellowiella coeruleoviolacea]|uniref:FAD/FMN-containing dehydrogenase n=1 Tax=Goodfellowiella coeruleoviolacea TaxID=334858 RepID=A0AAE3GQC1_9PSEU|nr:FAD-binding protein [Goodfellowiella coeruleoviolacea]MCP2170203.1 FAD/FMN-containing dehydrogenase [Goodfellowiella coeruleoviolacea]